MLGPEETSACDFFRGAACQWDHENIIPWPRFTGVSQFSIWGGMEGGRKGRREGGRERGGKGGGTLFMQFFRANFSRNYSACPDSFLGGLVAEVARPKHSENR